MTGPARPIEGRRGFVSIMSSSPSPDRITDGLADSWECARISFKPYACGVVAHPAIDAAIALRGELAGRAAEAEEVIAGVHPVVCDVMGITEPATGLQGEFSVIHCVAAGMLDGYAGPQQFTDARVQAADARTLRRVIQVRTDPGLAKDAAWIQVRLRDGGELRHDVQHATGSIDKPLTDEDIRMKAKRGFGPASAEQAEQLMDLAFGLEQLSSVAPLIAALRLPDPGLAGKPPPA
jgi:2-methylcitrate dehydratase PrpD